MSKIREAGYVNDFVMFRNACEERKLKYTLSQIEKMKKSYNKEQDKARLFFAVQYLAVPTRRKQSVPERSRSATNSPTQKKLLTKRKSFSTVTVPVFQADQKTEMEVDQSVEQLADVQTLPSINIKTDVTEQDTEIPQEIQIKAGQRTLPMHAGPQTLPINAGQHNGAKHFKENHTFESDKNENEISKEEDIVTVYTNDNSKMNIEPFSVENKRQSTAKIEPLIVKSGNDDLVSDNRSTILRFDKRIKPSQTTARSSSPGLGRLKSKEEWERKLEAMKPSGKSISRKEQVELARVARDSWRQSFDNMKLQRLSLYQSRILSNTGDKEKTFVKFLPKNEQAFYLKDVQFAQKFL